MCLLTQDEFFRFFLSFGRIHTTSSSHNCYRLCWSEESSHPSISDIHSHPAIIRVTIFIILNSEIIECRDGS
jgi:hypothetical protein